MDLVHLDQRDRVSQGLNGTFPGTGPLNPNSTVSTAVLETTLLWMFPFPGPRLLIRVRHQQSLPPLHYQRAGQLRQHFCQFEQQSGPSQHGRWRLQTRPRKSTAPVPPRQRATIPTCQLPMAHLPQPQVDGADAVAALNAVSFYTSCTSYNGKSYLGGRFARCIRHSLHMRQISAAQSL